MSFILDALKKSEAERQRQNAPGIASIPESGRQKHGAKWGWIIGGLLALNLGVLGAIMLRPAEVTVAAGPESRPAAAATSPSARPADTTGNVSTAAPEPAPRSAAAPAAERPMAGPEPAPTPAPAPAPAKEAVPQATAALPSFNEVRTQGLLSLPDMHLDIHVYSGQPADRFVFVNMTKYTEGAQLTEGPAVREITPDGVVLEYLGTTFLLPRE